MNSELVKRWFGDRFADLHPLLQQLHVEGGNLKGRVDISYGKSVAGILGRRIAHKMRLPKAGSHELLVTITHDDVYMHWSRRFDDQQVVESLFQPVGHLNDGYWIESTGPLEMWLTVDVKDGGWYWRCLKVYLFGCPIPLWLIPNTDAYKVIEDDKYRFHVSFSHPLFGVLVKYEGILDAVGEGL